MLDLSDLATQEVIDRLKTLSDRIAGLRREACTYRKASNFLASESCEKEISELTKELRRVSYGAAK